LKIPVKKNAEHQHGYKPGHIGDISTKVWTMYATKERQITGTERNKKNGGYNIT
jgi:hypothetical protein